MNNYLAVMTFTWGQLSVKVRHRVSLGRRRGLTMVENTINYLDPSKVSPGTLFSSSLNSMLL